MAWNNCDMLHDILPGGVGITLYYRNYQPIPAAKGHWNSEDSESLESLVALMGLRITFAVYGIHNWLSGICTFLMVCALIWVVVKVVEIIVKVDEP